uniref:E2 ubiquitin-conjugating enzyme n=1 Tax=Eucampia antarctica TaxID=49252 RepID=A0A6U0S8R1_9STRA|mmetsp:Transcript_25904/g.24761  ORF Transcript_25904/g.24761 Transcript_25904/m.24761 type:complete len:222 (+) Transcript_25904:235-900(+)|eukprot:CAMPEP_0197833186 /NCGR_PEP_ID=MMETSP1437-20131217/18124_1 /TAXON_ID=49252 ORGANISM="Eucampia antarctica, Strain CCMP1452" /NCGR_SAMPLE_ID=MMETSP1437 /ASSEMBLY_ACC=CAM_ASM_001096 /LENGTH=221 /DNA_ID=CAMNT_0043437081 /DNA_START=418 /DNA_END=1083 /DNA_ORIENTATION=+
MSNDMCTRRLQRELQSLMKNPMSNPRVLAVPNEANILEWHYCIEGSKETPYEGGHYHGKLLFPKEYPLKPPSVMMLTPSGRFKPNRRLCLSMSDFHPESWNPMWSVSTIITGLISFMVEKAPTLGSIETKESQKRKFARQSLDFNVRDATFCKLFPELVTLHQKRMDERRKALGASGASLTNNDITSMRGPMDAPDEIQGFTAIAAGVFALLSILFAMRFF